MSAVRGRTATSISGVTAEKFIQDPFSKARRAIYKTGTWAYRRDGAIEFLGIDDR